MVCVPVCYAFILSDGLCAWMLCFHVAIRMPTRQPLPSPVILTRMHRCMDRAKAIVATAAFALSECVGTSHESWDTSD